jgi:hypothetical protein
MTDPIRATATATVEIGRAAASTPFGAIVAVAGVALVVVNLAAILTALLWLAMALAALIIAALVARHHFGQRAQAWRPFAGDGIRINTGAAAIAGQPCRPCLPVRVPATAVLIGPTGDPLPVCTPHIETARVRALAALTKERHP